MSKGCLESASKVSGRRMEGVLLDIICGCLEGVWKVSETCLEGVWKVSRRCLEDVWKVYGRCLEGVSSGSDTVTLYVCLLVCVKSYFSFVR